MIPYGRQDITQKDIDSVIEVLKSDFLTQGPKVPLFEEVISNIVGVKHSVAVNSATSALHVACLAIGLGKGDWLWTTSITFVASANCGLYCGAQVGFVDINSKTYNICTETLAAKLELAEQEGKLPKILVLVHLCGQSCEMERIGELSKRFGFRVIEDASHAIGGKYKGEYIGSCKFSEITIFSFHPVKVITTAEGGMAVTNDDSLAEKMKLLRSHGITRDQNLMTHESDGPWYYQQIELGYNYRMTELQAALGVSQSKRLDLYVTRRQELAKRYDKVLKDLPITIPWQHPDTYSAFHLYIIRLELKLIKRSHRDVYEFLRDQGIGVNIHYIPVHTQPYYLSRKGDLESLPNSEQYYKEAISLPLHPGMTVQQQDQVISTLILAIK